jgi:hypothetical protein
VKEPATQYCVKRLCRYDFLGVRSDEQKEYANPCTSLTYKDIFCFFFNGCGEYKDCAATCWKHITYAGWVLRITRFHRTCWFVFSSRSISQPRIAKCWGQFLLCDIEQNSRASRNQSVKHQEHKVLIMELRAELPPSKCRHFISLCCLKTQKLRTKTVILQTDTY